MMSASEVKANVRWQALSWTSEGYYSLYDYQRTAHNSGFYFFFPRNTLNLDCSHVPAHTHTQNISVSEELYHSIGFNMQASSWWYQINGEFQIRHSRWDRQRRPSLAHINRTLSCPSRSQLSLFFFWWSNWVRLNCPVMLIKNINFKCGKVFFVLALKVMAWLQCYSIITNRSFNCFVSTWRSFIKSKIGC